MSTFYLNTSHSSKSAQSTCQNSSPLSHRHHHEKRKHPKNAFIVNFSPGEHVTEEVVRSEFSSFGSVRSVIMCTVDACQAFVAFGDEPDRAARQSVSHLLRITSGIMFVSGNVWTICRPKTWKKLTDDATRTATSDLESGKTVSELTDIFQNFLRLNSSISQTSMLSPPIQSSSMNSFSSVSLNRGPSSSSSSAAESCDSSVTITPFSFYPVQESTGFIQLPPPYHLLPDTAFFRSTKIVPPPPRGEVKESLAQKINDQYIASARISDSMHSGPRMSSSKLELQCRWWNPV